MLCNGPQRAPFFKSLSSKISFGSLKLVLSNPLPASWRSFDAFDDDERRWFFINTHRFVSHTVIASMFTFKCGDKSSLKIETWKKKNLTIYFQRLLTDNQTLNFWKSDWEQTPRGLQRYIDLMMRYLSRYSGQRYNSIHLHHFSEILKGGQSDFGDILWMFYIY